MINIIKYWKWIVGVATGIIAILTAYNMLQGWKPVFAEDLKALENEIKIEREVEKLENTRKRAMIKAEFNLKYWTQEVRSYHIHPPVKVGDERIDSVNRNIWLEDLNVARGEKKKFKQKLDALKD